MRPDKDTQGKYIINAGRGGGGGGGGFGDRTNGRGWSARI